MPFHHPSHHSGHGSHHRHDERNGRKPGQKLDYSQDLFAEVFSFGNLAVGAQDSETVQVQADSAFEWIKTTVYGEPDGVAPPIVDNDLQLSCMISDGGNGRQLFSAPMPVNMVAGSGKLPFILPVTRIFEPTSTIVIDLTNFGTIKYNNVFIAMWGRKLFKYSRGS